MASYLSAERGKTIDMTDKTLLADSNRGGLNEKSAILVPEPINDLGIFFRFRQSGPRAAGWIRLEYICLHISLCLREQFP